ncbi:hypothetical protein [Streptomyces melanogenes]|uniref:hypothetical protein n=1 Tax=Streptomyces melanogenes TaxID=67326 RepID=UPI00379A879D
MAAEVSPIRQEIENPAPNGPSWAVVYGGFEVVPIDSLLPADTPRSAGTDPEHVQRLTDMAGTTPPILVQRATLRVIDGMHRLHAARARGDDKILIQYFEGSDEQSFVHSVRANVTHGLPLTAGERQVAAARILRMYPDWSDRAIADVAGISPPTVATIRHRSTEKSWQLNTRVGRDGRRRPINGTIKKRQKALEIIQERPHATIREVAREAGISVGAAYTIRVENTSQPEKRTDTSSQDREIQTVQQLPSAAPQNPGRAEVMQPATQMRAAQHRLLDSLRKDPLLRRNDKGRQILQWLSVLSLEAEQLRLFVDVVPAYRLGSLAQLAHNCSITWQHLAREMEGRSRRAHTNSSEEFPSG